MGKQSRLRREKRKLSEKKQKTPTAVELIANGDLTAAIALLREQLVQTPNDEIRRLLADCLLKTKEHQEALTILEQIQIKRAHDLLLLGWLYIRLTEWESAAAKCLESLQLEERAETYYWLSVATAKGYHVTYGLAEETRKKVIDLLNKAIDLPGCRLEAFTWLEDFQDWSSSGVQRKVEILSKAVSIHTTDSRIRSNLAILLLRHLSEPNQALDVLAPLLVEDAPEPQALWYAYEAYKEKKEAGTALSFIERLWNGSEYPAFEVAKAKGDLLLELGQYEAALACYDLATIKDDLEARIIGWFSRAYTLIKINKIPQAINELGNIEALVLSFPQDSDMCSGVAYTEFGPLDYSAYVEHVCRTVIEFNKSASNLTPRLQSVLYYLWYKVTENSSRADLALLLKATELADYPQPSNDAAEYFAQESKIALAVHHHLNFCLLLHDRGDEFLSEDAELTFYSSEGEENVVPAEESSAVHASAVTHLRNTQDPKIIRDIFIPFYDQFWRKVLFDNEMFKEVIEVTSLFVQYTNGEEGLFDYAYGLNATGDAKEAEAVYKRLLLKEPDNSAALNNLAVIFEGEGLPNEAYEYFSKALNLNPNSELYSRNHKRLKAKIDAQHLTDKASQAITQKALAAGLSLEQHRELNEFYWDTDLSTVEIGKYFGISRINQFIIPKTVNQSCPNCGSWLGYKSRTARNAEELSCTSCTHTTQRYRCTCDYCQRQRAEEQRQAEERRRAEARKAFEDKLQDVSKPSYVTWAISTLSRKEKIFLKAFIQVTSENTSPTWEMVCDRANVVGHKKYLEKLTNVGLLLQEPGSGVIKNPSVKAEMIELPTVRRITPSIRFDVFQRDSHTCQYCGRRPPEVELEVDHLTPVAMGGTDEFDNLVTSCKECNSGKSAKLINDHTGGYSKEEWRERLKARRIEMLQNRRAMVDEVIQYWTECRNTRRISDYELEAVHNLIERYDPEWIKKAIFIASKRKPDNYVKYVAGTLRNWAKNGPPEKLHNPDASLESKKATEKQIRYIQSLLSEFGLQLGEFYHKSDFETLTMLDARNLIEALKATYDEEEEEHQI